MSEFRRRSSSSKITFPDFVLFWILLGILTQPQTADVSKAGGPENLPHRSNEQPKPARLVSPPSGTMPPLRFVVFVAIVS